MDNKKTVSKLVISILAFSLFTVIFTALPTLSVPQASITLSPPLSPGGFARDQSLTVNSEYWIEGNYFVGDRIEARLKRSISWQHRTPVDSPDTYGYTSHWLWVSTESRYVTGYVSELMCVNIPQTLTIENMEWHFTDITGWESSRFAVAYKVEWWFVPLYGNQVKIAESGTRVIYRSEITACAWTVVNNYALYGSGGVNNPSYILGYNPDYYFANIYSYAFSSAYQVTVSESYITTGWNGLYQLKMFAYTWSGYEPRVHVYVQDSDWNWIYVGNQVVSNLGPQWITIGYTSNFIRVTLVVETQYGKGGGVLHVDTVNMVPMN